MFLYKSETDTHFQCPQCGQHGSVATERLEHAVRDNAHVQISCSTCQTEFQPYGDANEVAGAGAGANEGADATKAADETDAQEALPRWLRPPDAPEQSVGAEDKPKPAPDADDIYHQATDAPAAVSDSESPDDPIKRPEIDRKPPPDAPPDEPFDTPPDARADESGTDNAPMPRLDALPAARQVGETPNTRPAAKAASGAPVALNAILLLVVLALTGFTGYVLLRDHPRVAALRALAPPKSAGIQVHAASFDLLRTAQGDSVMVSVTFTNSGAKAETIGDFTIHLQNANRQTLMTWTVFNSGQTVPPNGRRVITSTQLGPPAALAHVTAHYPLAD